MTQETPSPEQQPEKPKAHGPRTERLRQRIAELDDALDAYPDAAVLYLRRGQLFARLNMPDLARADYEKAQTLADAETQQGDWALVEQAVGDQARRLLRGWSTRMIAAGA